MDNKINKEIVKKISDMADSIGNIKEELISNANKNMSQIKDVKTKAFMEQSLKRAIEGNLSADEFLANLNNLNNQ